MNTSSLPIGRGFGTGQTAIVRGESAIAHGAAASSNYCPLGTEHESTRISPSPAPSACGRVHQSIASGQSIRPIFGLPRQWSAIAPIAQYFRYQAQCLPTEKRADNQPNRLPLRGDRSTQPIAWSSHAGIWLSNPAVHSPV